MIEHHKKLIIPASLSKFSFVIKDTLSNEIIFFASEAIDLKTSLEEQLDQFFLRYKQLTAAYDEILVYHDNCLNTFVPHAYFDEQHLGHYLQYNTKVFSTDYFDYDQVGDYDFNNVFIPYVSINNYLLDKYTSFTYKNINTPLVDCLLQKSTQEEGVQVYAFIKKDHFELVLANNGKLILFNSFTFQNAQDFIYYILFTYEQLQLDPESVPLHLLGRVDKRDALYEEAYTYIRFVTIIEDKAAIHEDLLLHHLVPKQHYILFHS